MAEAHPSQPQNSTNVRVEIFRSLFRTLSAMAPGAAVPLAAALFRTTHRAPRPPREQRWAERARRVSLPHRSGSLPGWSWGEGPGTVLLVHGWSGRGLQLGAFAAPLVARGLRVVAYDAPAHGEATGRRSSLPELTAAVAGVALSLGPLEAVVAHSLGGTAALWASARFGLEAERFVTLGSPSDFVAITDRFAAATGFSPRVMTRVRRRLERELGFRWGDLAPARLTASLGGPLLVVHDREDREIPWAEGAALVRSAPGARLLLTSGLGHRRLLSDPRVVSAVTGFLAARQAPVLSAPASTWTGGATFNRLEPSVA